MILVLSRRSGCFMRYPAAFLIFFKNSYKNIFIIQPGGLPLPYNYKQR